MARKTLSLNNTNQERLPIAVLVSGGGTNLQALIDASEQRDEPVPYRIAVVVADREGTGAIERAIRHGIPHELALPPKELNRPLQRQAVSDRVLEIMGAYQVEAIVLAGFLTIMSGNLISQFAGRMINLHPALLPKFGGPGMWGHHVHEAVLASGDSESGCTVHLVDSGCDTGRILLQKKVPVLSGDTPESLANRIHAVEHEAVLEGTILLARSLQT